VAALSAQESSKIPIGQALVAPIVSLTLPSFIQVKVYPSVVIINLELVNMLLPLQPALTPTVSPTETVTTSFSSQDAGSHASLPTWVEPCNAMDASCPVAPDTLLQLSGETWEYTRPSHWSGNSSLAVTFCMFHACFAKCTNMLQCTKTSATCFVLVILVC
jgi:hypothetical protein